MAAYQQMSREELKRESEKLAGQYKEFKARGLKLDLSRGKPGKTQLDLSMDMMDTLSSSDMLTSENGADCRNYGELAGIPEARRLMASILETEPDEVIVGGNSSLNLMHDCVSIGFIHGYPGGNGGWHRQDKVKFLCPSPGYDRHFSIAEHFGFELITVPMKSDGPDMDMVERLVKDSAVKGMWCVPKYSNPQGITYSDDVVRRIASLSPAAGDFRVFWDNAYAVHDLDPNGGDVLSSLLGALKKAGNPDMALLFTSTSKMTFPGAGISAIGASKANIEWLLRHYSMQTISFDKINMLRHVRYFGDIGGIKAHMAKHAAILRPKFAAVLSVLEKELSAPAFAHWTNPAGGYFISLDVAQGCAKRTVALCKEAGVVMTGAGATFPYGKDPYDRNIRIAPSFAAPDEAATAANLLCLCAKIACIEKLLA